MIFETGDLESVPVICTMALAKRDEWFVEIHHDAGVTKGELLAADWTNVLVRPEDGEAVSIGWDSVQKVVVP